MNMIDIIEFINDVTGSTEKITMDSGIYKHDYGDLSHKPKNSKYDLYVIDGTKKPIECKDIIKVLNKMKKQFENTYVGRSYIFEGIRYNKQEKCCKLCWGS